MSEPAKAEKKIGPPKATTAKPKRSAPLPKQPGTSAATPALARLRRELGEMLAGFKGRKTHMFQIYAVNVKSALDGALRLRAAATDAERKELDALELRARLLLLHVPASGAKAEDSGLTIDWDFVSDSLDQIVPGIGPAVTQAPQAYRDCFEAVMRSTLHIKTAFSE